MSNEEQSEKKLDKFTEFECKYRTDLDKLIPFKKIAGNLPNLKEFLFVEGFDTFYVLPGDTSRFGRYRIAQYPVDGPKFAQWTIKTKPDGAKNNTKRHEPNWLVIGTSREEIDEGAKAMGFEYGFSIYKFCHVYKFSDATIVFYSVIKGDSKPDHFIEIEVDEESIHELTETQAWEVINKYEKLLAEVEITPQKRLRKSLFEIYQ